MMSPLSEQYVSYVLDRARASCRRGGYSDSTTKHYLHWIRRFMEVCEVSGPQDLHADNARAFLNTLSGYARPTQKQARRALYFLFNTVLVDGAVLPEQMGQKPPAVLSQADSEGERRPTGSVSRSSSPWSGVRESALPTGLERLGTGEDAPPPRGPVPARRDRSSGRGADLARRSQVPQRSIRR